MQLSSEVPDSICYMTFRLFRLSACFLLFVGVLFWPVFSFCERLPVKIYTSADGLGSGFVDYLYRDSRGFMWFCTRDGLSRFDGSRFVTYKIGGDASPPGIENIYETSDGMFWVTTTGGTFRFDPTAAAVYVDDTPHLQAERVTGWRGTLLQDSKGTLWLGSGGLYRVDKQDGTDTFVKVELDLPVNPKTSFYITEMAETADGSLWLSSSWGLVRRLPTGQSVFYEFVPVATGTNIAMLADRSGRIWFSVGPNLIVFKPEPPESFDPAVKLHKRGFDSAASVPIVSGSPVPLPRTGGEVYEFRSSEVISKRAAKRIFQTSDGDIWVTAENTLLRFAEGGVRLYTDKQGLPPVMVRMAEDAAGNLWIGGQSGLARLNRSGLVSYGVSDGLDSSRFYSINEAADGTMYFAQRDHFWTMFDGKRFETARPQIDPTASPLWTSRFGFLSRSGELWMLTDRKLYRFGDGRNVAGLRGRAPTAVYGMEDGLKSNSVSQIFEDSEGSIWVSVRGLTPEGHGIARMRAGESRFTHFTIEDGFPERRSGSDYLEDTFGNLWIALYEGGLARFDGERFRVFTRDDGLPAAGHIADMHLDRKGRLWLATSSQGLYRVEDPSEGQPRFVQEKIESGSVSSNVRTLTEDRFGRLYLGTARGVDRYSPETGFLKRYSVFDGLASDFVVDSHCDRNGDLWFATNNGISRLSPLPDERTDPPKILIGKLLIANDLEPVSSMGTDSIEKGELSYSNNNFQIEYFGLDLRAGESLRFQYMLEGADSGWGAPTEATSVTYANLRPASYRFLVRAVNSEGAVSDAPATVSFVIVPPVWQRWWFVMLAALVVAGLTIIVFKYRTAKLREVNRALSEAKLAEEQLRRAREERLTELEKVRARIATDLHDDIGASLTQIAVLSEVAQTKAMAGNGAALEPLTRITDVSNELVGTMSDIVWSINPAKDHLSDLTQRMRRFASDLLSPRNIGFGFVTPEASNEIVVSSNTRREIFLIFKESINNIAKHSGCTDVRVKLAIDGDELLFQITDNGSGFAESGSDESIGGNGIPNMRRRAAALGARLNIRSEKGAGTSITLHVPLVDATHA
jgi:signal transduction histidine kinase/ligand-binding sensor domain-containing protein